jgi:Mn2+/Fe2+ NRAMP family transporter
MLLFKALHILSMFAAVTFLVGEALLYGRAIWRRDVAGLAAARRLLGRRPLIGVGFLVAGIVFGALAAVTGAIDLLDGWLIAAYVAVLALFAVNASPWVQRLPQLGEAAIQAPADGPSGDDVLRAIEAARPSTLVVVIVNVVLFAAIILDMVFKPF